jgi:hypothetical protein
VQRRFESQRELFDVESTRDLLKSGSVPGRSTEHRRELFSAGRAVPRDLPEHLPG